MRRWRWALSIAGVGVLALLATFAPWRKPATAAPLNLGGASTRTLNVKDFVSFQAAVDALESAGGGILEVPPGTYDSTTTPVFDDALDLPTRVILRGAGRDVTILHQTSPNEHNITIDAGSGTGTGNNRIEDITIKGANSGGTGVGIYTYNASRTLSDLYLKNVVITQTPSWGIQMDLDSGRFIDQCYFENVVITQNKTNGAMSIGTAAVAGANIMTFVKCQFNGSSYMNKYGADSLWRGTVHISQSTDLNFIGCSFQNDSSVAVSFGSITRNVSFVGCHFERSTEPDTVSNHVRQWFTVGVPSNMTGLNVIGCTFQRVDPKGGYRVLKVGNTAAATGVLFVNNFFHTDYNVYTTDDIDLGTSGNGDVTLYGNVSDQYEIQVANRTAKTRTGTTYVKTTSGAPLTGTWNTGDIVVSSTVDTMYVCKAGGTPGTWRRVGVAVP